MSVSNTTGDDSIDLYVTLVVGMDDLSDIVKEIIEYAVELVERRYGMRIVYRRVHDEECSEPYMIINELEPIVFDRVPSLKTIVELLLMVGETKRLGIVNGFNDISSRIYGY